MFNKIKLPLLVSCVALLSISLANVSSASPSPEQQNRFDQELRQAMNDEIKDQGYSPLSDDELKQTNDNFAKDINKKSFNPKLKQRLNDLSNAEVVLMSFDENGNLVQADSNKDANALERFQRAERKDPASDEVNTATIMPNSSPTPAGANSGALHRIKTQYSTSLTSSYTGAVADSIVLPTVNISNEYSAAKREASYLYVGIDSATSSYAEVGFSTLKTASVAAAWYPVFHSVGGSLNTGYNSNSGNGYYYDITKPYANGSTVTGFKVYYKYDESYLKIRYLIGSSTLYILDYTSIAPTKLAMKRLTTLAMNDSDTTTKFVVPWTTYATWNNFRFNTNNGSAAMYPSQLSLLENVWWNHGGTIDYTTNGSTSNLIETYRIY